MSELLTEDQQAILNELAQQPWVRVAIDRDYDHPVSLSLVDSLQITADRKRAALIEVVEIHIGDQVWTRAQVAPSDDGRHNPNDQQGN